MFTCFVFGLADFVRHWWLWWRLSLTQGEEGAEEGGCGLVFVGFPPEGVRGRRGEVSLL